MPAPHDPGWVRVFGRVLMGRPDTPYRAWVRSRGWRSFITAQVADAAVTVEVGGCTYPRPGRPHRARRHRPAGRPDPRAPPGPDDARGRRGRRRRGARRRAVGRRRAWSATSTTRSWSRGCPRPFIAAWNTFVRQETARSEVPGMAELYTEFLTAHPGAFVVYLSTGAWNTAPFLRRFLRTHDYPTGPLLLTDWGPTNTGWFRSGRVHKIGTPAAAAPGAAAPALAAGRRRRPARPRDLLGVLARGARGGPGRPAARADPGRAGALARPRGARERRGRRPGARAARRRRVPPGRAAPRRRPAAGADAGLEGRSGAYRVVPGR